MPTGEVPEGSGHGAFSFFNSCSPYFGGHVRKICQQKAKMHNIDKQGYNTDFPEGSEHSFPAFLTHGSRQGEQQPVVAFGRDDQRTQLVRNLCLRSKEELAGKKRCTTRTGA